MHVWTRESEGKTLIWWRADECIFVSRRENLFVCLLWLRFYVTWQRSVILGVLEIPIVHDNDSLLACLYMKSQQCVELHLFPQFFESVKTVMTTNEGTRRRTKEKNCYRILYRHEMLEESVRHRENRNKSFLLTTQSVLIVGGKGRRGKQDLKRMKKQILVNRPPPHP